MHIDELYKIYRQYPSIKIDSRKIQNGDIFFALKGDNFNGNAFAKQALETGAVYAVIDEMAFEIPGKTILVESVLETLQQLAKFHRQQLSIPFVAITGSNGKTTTKELIHAVLASTYKTYTTEGNLNNHIGIPLTILKIKADAEIAVIEMGANHIGEIASYCKIALPTHGLITNCGKAHLEGFGSEEGVRKGKGELFDHLRSTNGIAFLMKDYSYLSKMSNGITEIHTYGTKDAEIEGEVLKNDPFLEVKIKKGSTISTIKTLLTGEYNLPNVLAAVAVGKYFKVSDEKIKSSIENYTPSNSRSQLIKKGKTSIILDAYNANPSSMKLAIENFAKMNSENKILLLGAMAELGKQSIEEHRSIIDLILEYKWKNVVLVGGDFLKFDHPFLKFENAEQAKQWYHRQNFDDCSLLIKGSRSMQMEKILE